MGDEIEFSEKQKNGIYVEYLKPLKLKISQILLYDEKSASVFLKKYNDLLENTKDNEILEKITDLEIEIGEYEKGIGKRKRVEEKSEAMIAEIKDLIENGDQLSLDEFNEKVQSLLKKYQEDILGYSFKDRDVIEEKIYELRAKMILRKVKEENCKIVDISKEDESGLLMYINEEIERLQSNENPQIHKVIKSLKDKLKNGVKAIYDSETWKLLDYAQNGKYEKEEANLVEETALVVRTQNNNSIIRRLLSFFAKEPQLPLQEAKLPKITIDWLSEYISKEMIEEYERKKNDVKKYGEIYLMTPKAFICDFFDKMERLGFDNLDKSDLISIEREYSDGESGKKKLSIYGDRSVDGGKNKYINIGIKTGHIERKIEDIKLMGKWGDIEASADEKYGKNHKYVSVKRNAELINYAELLDRIFGTNYKNQMFCAYEQFIITQNVKYLQNNRLFIRLAKSFDKLQDEYEKNQSYIRDYDNLKRADFDKANKANKFIKGIRVDQKSLEESDEKTEIEKKN